MAEDVMAQVLLSSGATRSDLAAGTAEPPTLMDPPPQLASEARGERCAHNAQGAEKPGGEMGLHVLKCIATRDQTLRCRDRWLLGEECADRATQRRVAAARAF